MHRYTIVGLSPFTEYSVRISATNKLGEGGKSEPSLRKDSYKTKEDCKFPLKKLNVKFVFFKAVII